MDKGDRVFVTELPTTVNHFLTAALHLWVFTLHRSKIQIFSRLARSHRRGCATTETDVHRRASEYDQFCPHWDLFLLNMLGANVTHTAGNHDRLVITTHLFTSM
ncbi:Uncharacterised protein [Vibrio cholerae]|nr:Uncharacterised protein [Vibrio cholerae]